MPGAGGTTRKEARGERRTPGAGAAGVVALVVLAAAAAVLLPGGSAAEGTRVEGRVVDENGTPVAGASIVGPGARATSADDGSFTLDLEQPALVSVEADGHLPRTLALGPGEDAAVPLTTDVDGTFSLRIGGDVMFGRRYLDPDGDGDRSDALLPVGATSEEHAALLQHVQPLLADADLTVVNLETPLVDEPWFAPGGPRPAGWQPTKEIVFASSRSAADALAATGVDAVSLGNNHVMDALQPGLEQTLVELERAGLAYFGAGLTVDEAWRPAFVEHGDQMVAMLACTTVAGSAQAVPNIATADHGGAALCTPDRLDREVRAARSVADVVLVMIHGGTEYEALQVDHVRRLTQVAVDAGATVVANGHPHVVGGITLNGDTLVAESTGNLLFDQNVWPTFLSYLLRVDVRDGVPVLATTDPLLLEDYVPRPVVGGVAEASSRRAAGLLGPDGLLAAPGAVVGGAPALHTRTLDLPAGEVVDVPAGWWLDRDQELPTGLAVGQELLWTGSFEDVDTDPDTRGGHGWRWSDAGSLTATAACTGTQGLELRRSPISTADVIGTPEHRQLVTAGTRLSLLADVRQASEGSTMELHFYTGTRGGSAATVAVEIPEGSPDDCRTVRLDAVAPPGTVAAQPFVRLTPPAGSQRAARLAVDDIRLVAWSPVPGTGPLWNAVESSSAASVDLVGAGPA